jgi:hypothetical protein
VKAFWYPRALVKPGREDAIKDDALEVHLLDPDRLEVGLVIVSSLVLADR